MSNIGAPNKPRWHTKYQWKCMNFQNGNEFNMQRVVQVNQYFLVQTPLGPWLGLRTHPCCDAPGDLQVEFVGM